MRWQRQPIEERRASVIRNLLALTTGAVILWIGLGIYIPILADLQSRYGADFFGMTSPGLAALIGPGD